MSFRTYALLPFVCTFVLLGTHMVVTPLAQWGSGLDIVSLIAKMSALMGAILAARSFDRGDYMRRAFALEIVTFGCLVIRDCFALIRPIRAFLEAAQVYDSLWRVLFVSANVAGVCAALMMARAAKLAAFDGEETRFRGYLWLVLATFVGISLTGPSIVLSAVELREGRLHSFIVLIGSLADLAAFILTVPVVRLAYALRGGLLHVPWTMLATARMFWLVRDCVTIAPPWLWQHPAFLLIAEATRTLACTYDLSAGLAFRRIFTAPAETQED
jgi:hypothetical protein